MALICYSFDRHTGVYNGMAYADPSPLEPGSWLYPADTTTLAPPATQAGFAAVWSDGAWIEVADHRGETWWHADGRQEIVGVVGDPTEYGLLHERPADPEETDATPDPTELPDGPTLGDWRVALVLWGRLDQVTAAIASLKASPDGSMAMIGNVVEQRIEYSQHVFRAELMAFHDLLGFSEAEVDESLWRAHQVSLGDLSGVWPIEAGPQ